jgi:RHS repeat-associated protein
VGGPGDQPQVRFRLSSLGLAGALRVVPARGTQESRKAAGTVSDTYLYGAFGKALPTTGSTANTYLFTGNQFDPGLNQYYLRARYYDQARGRFSSFDSYEGIGSDPSSLHKYLYTSARADCSWV